MTDPTVVISVDLELSWGTFDLSFGENVQKMARWTHDIGAPLLLDHLTGNGLSATWAVVGAMMNSSLPDVSALPEVRFPHFAKSWFTYTPRFGDELSHPEWFGASLLKRIRAAKPAQEIGFHSFSHVLFGWPGMTRERAVAEYEYCARIARRLGLETTSFVFPRNSIHYLPELRDAGFSCFRDVDEPPFPFANKKLNPLIKVFADFLGLAPRIVEPKLKNGMVAIPGSMMIRNQEGWRKFIPDANRLLRLRKGLEKVRKRGGVFHIWFHPENLYEGRPRIENIVARFCEELGDSVRNGEVRCLTMGQLAGEFRQKFTAAKNSARPEHTASAFPAPAVCQPDARRP